MDKYLNEIYELKDKIGEDEVEFLDELLEDVESWRVCIDEIELSIKSYINTEKQKEYRIDKQNKEIIIY
ncbi:hypothetical protein N8873_00430 [Flavobacteriaceae bacterium]|nr:hypothetical protein [Flavobacteriaceae bacterium]